MHLQNNLKKKKIPNIVKTQYKLLGYCMPLEQLWGPCAHIHILILCKLSHNFLFSYEQSVLHQNCSSSNDLQCSGDFLASTCNSTKFLYINNYLTCNTGADSLKYMLFVNTVILKKKLLHPHKET